MPTFYHPDLPREQTVEHPLSPGKGWLPVDETSTPEQPAEPVNDEQASDPLDHEKEN